MPTILQRGRAPPKGAQTPHDRYAKQNRPATASPPSARAPSQRTGRPEQGAAVTLAPLAPAPDGDLLTRVIEGVRPLLADATQPTKARIRLLWAAAKHARKLGATDVVSNAFTALAVETNLIDRHGHWTGTDVRDYVRKHGGASSPKETQGTRQQQEGG